MALSQPKAIFGVHSITAYNLKTRLPLGIAKVLGEASISSEGETIPLTGGSSKYAWKVERGLITAEVGLNLTEYPDFLFETLLGKAITVNSAESGGSTTTLENANGTSVFEATTGIASVAIKTGSESDVKFTGLTVKAVTATTVDVYATTDVDFAQGTDKVFEDDLLKITETPLTILMGAAVEIPGYGLELTGGSGTIAMTIDDTATFETRPINTASREVVVGSSTEVFTDFGLLLAAQRQGDGEMTLIDCYSVVGAGLPIGMTTNEWSPAEVTLMLQRDTTRNGIYSFKNVSSISC